MMRLGGRLKHGLRFATVAFDVDSTLASIEGIDWLAEQRAPDVARECAALTSRAMAGELPIEAVYVRRLEAIAPTGDEIDVLAEAYRASIALGAEELIAELHEAGAEVHLISGGLRRALLPMARDLGVPEERVHAVELTADSRGRFVVLDGPQPLATQQGKAMVLSRLTLPRPTVIVGDGSTDAAARGVTDGFIAYTGVSRRPTVTAVADAEASDFAALHALLFASIP
jgi:phosphoserine phosphatase